VLERKLQPDGRGAAAWQQLLHVFLQLGCHVCLGWRWLRHVLPRVLLLLQSLPIPLLLLLVLARLIKLLLLRHRCALWRGRLGRWRRRFALAHKREAICLHHLVTCTVPSRTSLLAQVNPQPNRQRW
jgi:hypothetical protein